MRKVLASFITFGLLIVLSMAGQINQQDVPACPPLPDDPSLEKKVEPKYPKDAPRNGAGGTVDLRAFVDSTGRVKDLVLIDGDTLFSQPAEAAVRKWRFHPQMREGHPVESVYKIQVRFNAVARETYSDIKLESPAPEFPAASPLASVRRTDLGIEVHRMSEPGMVAPKQLYSPEPEFSEADRIAKHPGRVGIAIVVGADGLPTDLQVICSSIPDSTENALKAVKRWKFAPGTKDGKPVAVAVEVEVDFHLYDR